MKTFFRLIPPIVLNLMLAACANSAADDDKKSEPTAQIHTEIAMIGSSKDVVTAFGMSEAGPGGAHAIAAPAEAIVAAINAPTGTTVRAGTVVVSLRPSPATQAAVAKNSSDEAVAKAAYQRALRMRADGLASNADVETAKGALLTATSSLRILRIGSRGVSLRAPISGTVQGITIKPGDQVASGAPIATIGSQGDVHARFGVEPVIAQRIRPGQQIRIARMDGGNETAVVVVGVDPQVDSSTRLSSVYAKVPASAGIGIGEPLRATFSVGATSRSVSVPYAALLDDGGKSYVFVVKRGIAEAQDVLPGNSSGDRIQILRGLNPGDKVVTQGGAGLEDGMKVTELGAAE